MNINIQSIKFDADSKLIDFIEKKVEKLDKFFDNIIKVDVYLKIDNAQPSENKQAEIRLSLPGKELFAEKQCKSFEEATDLCIEALKKQMDKAKEKMRS